MRCILNALHRSHGALILAILLTQANVGAVTGGDDPTDPGRCDCPTPILTLTNVCPLYRGAPAQLSLQFLGSDGQPCFALSAQDWNDSSLGQCGFTLSPTWTPYGNWAIAHDPYASNLTPSASISYSCAGDPEPRYATISLPLQFKEPLFVDVGTVLMAGTSHGLADVLLSQDQPCLTVPELAPNDAPNHAKTFNDGYVHHDVRNGAVLLHGNSTAYAINPEAQGAHGQCARCETMACVSYQDLLNVPAVAGTYSCYFPISSPASRYNAAIGTCAPAAGQFQVFPRRCKVMQFSVATWIHPNYPRDGSTIQVGFSVNPSDVVWATPASGAPYSVSLSVWDPENGNRRTWDLWHAGNGTVLVEWDGMLLDSNGDAQSLTTSDYFMSADLCFEDRVRGDHHVLNGPHCFYERKLIVDVFSPLGEQWKRETVAAAGGVSTNPHRVLVRAYTNPSQDFTMTMALSGAEGGPPFEADGHKSGERRRAKAFLGGQVYEAGVSLTPITHYGSWYGRQEGYVLSSNKVEPCTLQLSVPEFNFSRPYNLEFQEGDFELEILEPAPWPHFVTIGVRSIRSFKGHGLSDHMIAYQPSKVVFVDGSVLEVNMSNILEIEQYVQMHSPHPQVNLPSAWDGSTVSSFEIINPLVTEVKISTNDFTVRKGD